jgi:hypothetical protein
LHDLKRTWLLLIITVMVMVVGVSACGGAGTGGGGNVQDPGEAGVRALLAEEVAAVRANDMDRRYNLESPAYRAACDRSKFGGGRAAYNGAGDWYGTTAEFGTGKLIEQNYSKLEVRDVKVKVEGTAAAVGFAIWAPGNSDKLIYHLSANYQAAYLDGRWWKNDPVQGGGLFAGIAFC